MIVCTKCGLHNPDGDTFCGQCGSFLEWVGEKVEPAPEAAVAPDEPAAEGAPRAGLIERVKSAVGIETKGEEAPPAGGAAGAAGPSGPAAAAGPSGPAVDAAAPDGAAAAAPTSPGVAASSPAGPSSDAGAGAGTVSPGSPAADPVDEGAAARQAATARAEALVAKPQPPGPAPVLPGRPAPAGAGAGATPDGSVAARQPEAVKPGRPVARQVQRQAGEPVQRINPGDLICGQCGQGNDPSRNFCRRCGASLKEAVVAKVPWWKRWFHRKPKQGVPAGTRPVGRAGAGKSGGRSRPSFGTLLKRILTVAVVVAVLVGLLVPSARRSVKRRLTSIESTFIYHYTPVDITKADAGANQLPGHEASNVFMGDVNSFWASGAPKPGTTMTVRLTFNQPSDVSLLRITPGDPTNFTGSPRPSLINYTFSDGKTHPPLHIENLNKPQQFKVSAKKAAYVDITVSATYPVAGSPLYAAIARIEVFVKKAGK